MTPALGIYVHWPFCLAKCPYCDFNSHVADAVDGPRWEAALLAELVRARDATGPRRVGSVFFGGGTPSLMEPRTVGAILEKASGLWTFDDDLEVTLEANPGASEAARFAAFAAAGVNRISLGVQALDDDALRVLGRVHDADEARTAVGRAAAAVPRVSFDLICARPGQTVGAWERELAEALAFAPEHLSIYQLTIEPGTAFHRARVPAADEDTGADLFAATRAALGAAGRPAYEVSNHAVPGAECRHNLAVWRGGDYVGVGPGAHGRITGPGGTVATFQWRDPARWLEAAERGDAAAKRTGLSAAERAEELLLSGLRLAEGLDAARFEAACGRPLASVLDADGVARMAAGGFAEADAHGLRLTEAGTLLLDSVLAAVVRPSGPEGAS